MKEKLTRETALNLHRQMWVDMLIKLGNNPSGLARTIFKRNWLQAHGYKDVECNCFLCEYDYQQLQQIKTGRNNCESCLIDWSPLSMEEDASCGDRYIHNNNNSDFYESIWKSAPIDEILNLPEKEGV